MQIHLTSPHARRINHASAVAPVAISVTANHDGFTMFNAIVNAIGLDAGAAKRSAISAQDERRIIVEDFLGGKLLIVPTAVAQDDIERLSLELIKIANESGIKELLFTHFGFIPSEFPESHIRTILDTLITQRDCSTLSTLWWEIDPRHKQAMELLLAQYFN